MSCLVRNQWGAFQMFVWRKSELNLLRQNEEKTISCDRLRFQVPKTGCRSLLKCYCKFRGIQISGPKDWNPDLAVKVKRYHSKGFHCCPDVLKFIIFYSTVRTIDGMAGFTRVLYFTVLIYVQWRHREGFFTPELFLPYTFRHSDFTPYTGKPIARPV